MYFIYQIQLEFNKKDITGGMIFKNAVGNVNPYV